MTRVGPQDARDIHAIEVRPGLVLVFHHDGVPAEVALAAVRQRVGQTYELLSVQTDRDTIPRIDAAMARHEDEEGSAADDRPPPGEAN